MTNISSAQYADVKAKLKDQYGVCIEKGYDKEFNKMSQEMKQTIADSFDSKMDLSLQDDLLAVMKETGVRRYQQLLTNEKCAAKLKELGISITAVDKNGNPVENAKLSHRDWIISRVDKDGKVIQDGEGKLAQFRWKDFNSDSYIQTSEAYVNDLLKAAGYDCVSRLDYSKDEVAGFHNIQGTASNITAKDSVASGAGGTKDSGGATGGGGSSPTGASPSGTGTTGSLGGEEQGGGDTRQKVTSAVYEQKVKDYMESKGWSKESATSEVDKSYVIDDSGIAA